MAMATCNTQCHRHNYPRQLTDCLPPSELGPVSPLPKIQGLVCVPPRTGRTEVKGQRMRQETRSSRWEKTRRQLPREHPA